LLLLTTTTVLWLSFVWNNPGEPAPKETSLTHTYRDHQSSLICFLHLLQSMAFSPFNLRA